MFDPNWLTRSGEWEKAAVEVFTSSPDRWVEVCATAVKENDSRFFEKLAKIENGEHGLFKLVRNALNFDPLSRRIVAVLRCAQAARVLDPSRARTPEVDAAIAKAVAACLDAFSTNTSISESRILDALGPSRWLESDPYHYPQAILDPVAALDGVSPAGLACARDLIGYFLCRGMFPRESVKWACPEIPGPQVTCKASERVRVLLVNQPGRDGSTAGLSAFLVVEAREGGFGAFYTDPVANGVFQTGRDFQRAVETAWKVSGHYRKTTPNCDVRWRLVRDDKTVPIGVEGPSMGLAFAMALKNLYDPESPGIDPGYAVTGGIDDQGSATTIGGYTHKIDEAKQRGFLGIIVPEVDKDSATLAFPAVGDGLILVTNLTEALETGAGIRSVVREYLTNLIGRLSELPRYLPRGVFTFEGISQRVRVREERKKHDRKAGDRKPDDIAYGVRAEEGAAESVHDWDDFSRDLRRAFILGDPGHGKTWLMKHKAIIIAVEALEALDAGASIGAIAMPMFVPLPSLARKLQNQSDEIDLNSFKTNLANIAVSSAGLTVSESPRLSKWIESRLDRDHVFLLLDSLDEVASDRRDELKDALKDFIPRFTGVMWLTSRGTGWDAPFTLDPSIKSEREVELVGFKEKQIREFVNRWFGKSPDRARDILERLGKDRLMDGLARIPLMLSFICLVFSSDKELSDSPLDLYDTVLRLLMEQPWERHKRRNVTPARIEKKLRILEHLAWTFGVESRWRDLFATNEVLECLNQDEDLLTELSEVDGILVTAGSSVAKSGVPYEFLHRTFHEYLAAKALSAREDLVTIFSRKYFDGEFLNIEVLPMVFGLVEDPADLYEALDGLPESLEQANLRLQVRSLAYVANVETVPKKTSNYLEARFLEIVDERKPEDTPYSQRTLDYYCRAGFSFRKRFSSLLVQKPRSRGRSRNATSVLGWLGVGTPEVIDALLGALRDENSDVREAAAWALGNLEAVTPEVVAGLLGALLDKDIYVRARAADALGNLKAGTQEVITGLLEALLYKDSYVRARAAEALGNLKAGTQEVITGLLGALLDKDSYVRWSATTALGKLKAVTPEVVAGLLGAMGDEEWYVRRNAAWALGNLQAVTSEVVSGLLVALRDEALEVRQSAAGALRNLKVVTPEVVAGLLVALRDEDSDVRMRAAWALGNLQAVTPEVVSGLLVALRDENSSVRRSAAEALGNLKAVTPEVVSGLLVALRDEDLGMRWRAAEALGKLQTPEAVAGLLEALRDEDWIVRETAAEALGNLKAGTQEVITGLLGALRDEDKYVRASAALALGNLQAVTPEVEAGLLGALRDEEEFVRRIAAAALVNLQAVTPEVEAGLLGALRDEEEFVRRIAAAALGDILDETSKSISSRISRNDVESGDESRFVASLKTILNDIIRSDPNFSFVLQKVARTIGYYSFDRAVLDSLHCLAESDGDEEVRLTAKEEAGKFANKLRVFGLLPDDTPRVPSTR